MSMRNTYLGKTIALQQKVLSKAASVLDSSAQSESLQRKADMANAAQRTEAPRPNNTGMPDNLKTGIENLSGFSMDDVRVHYNSSKPATVQALAYTQGTDIHVAPGQEKCLPHEAWHVAQQMAGRVSPTTNINGMPVNDNAALEHEADVMGEKAVQCENESNASSSFVLLEKKCVQRVKIGDMRDVLWADPAVSRIDAIKNISQKAAVYAEKKREDRNKIIMEETTKPSPSKDSLNRNFGGSEYGPFFVKFRSTYENQVEIALTYRFDFRLNSSKDEDINSVTNESDDEFLKRNVKDILQGIWKGEKGAGDAHGYVVLVEDENLKFCMNGYEIDDDQNNVNKFRCKHDDCSSSIGDKLGKDGDAYTKLAGEGARFQCVRNNLNNLTDDTIFYCRSYQGDFEICTFKNLWNSWQSAFYKKFNITDDEVAEKLREGKIKDQEQTGNYGQINLDLESDCEKFDCVKREKNTVTPDLTFGESGFCITYEKMARMLDKPQVWYLQFPIHDKDLYGWILKNSNQSFIEEKKADKLIKKSDDN